MFQQISTEDRFKKIATIRAKAEKAHSGPTTLWALSNSLKQFFQRKGVGTCVEIKEVRKDHLMFIPVGSRFKSMFLKDDQWVKFYCDLTDIAEEHGYEWTIEGTTVHMTRVP